MKRSLAAVLVLASTLAVRASFAQAPPVAAPSPSMPSSMRLAAFLSEVGRSNLELAAQRASVSIAEAQIAVARVFPDPTLTAGVASVDVGGKGSPTATTLGLGYTFELGGRRSARVAAAQSDHAAAKSELEDVLRTLRTTATNAFVDSLSTRLVLDRKRQTLKSLERLVVVNEERQRAGDVGKVALTQSRVEAQRFRGEVLAAEADVEAADLALSLQLGGTKRIAPIGDLKIKPRTFDVDALIANALATRPDLQSKRRAAEGASARVGLARANRWIDLTLNVSWQHTFAAPAPGFASPSYDALSATASVPIAVSRVYRGELDAALATEGQSRTTVRASELRIEVEVRQAHARYRAASAKLALYTGGLLADADQVLDATLYNYQRGGATLLEVLDAQRTQNDVYLAFYEALADHVRALVALEQASGNWDLEL